MEAILITIGDEILYGQTVDTNSAWMGQRLADIGIRVKEILSISDDEEAILEALQRGKDNADLILITGGLGPTKDDITKQTLAKFFNVELKMNKVILQALEDFFSKRGLPMLENNRQQAALPANCIALKNDKGTAWGMWFDVEDRVMVSMPGVPYEMKAIMTDEVLPKVKEKFDLPVIVHKHVLTAAIPESFLSEKLEPFEDQLPKEIKLAYLPSAGKVKLRLTAKGNDRERLSKLIEEQVKLLNETVGRNIYGYDDDLFEAAVGKILLDRNQSFCTAESCSGGLIAHMITSVPGSSNYYKGSVIAYHNEVKHKQLGVSQSTLDAYGAVSEETVKEMVVGAAKALEADYAIAVSGIAGPGGGSKEKPVGTVWVGVGNESDVKTRLFHFPGSREQNIQWSAVVALEMMRKYLIDLTGETKNP